VSFCAVIPRCSSSSMGSSDTITPATVGFAPMMPLALPRINPPAAPYPHHSLCRPARTTGRQQVTAERRHRYIAASQPHKRDRMNSYKGSGFADRLSMAAKARKAQLDRFRAQPGANDPAVADRNADRAAASIARETRVAERKAAKQAEAAAKKAALEGGRAAQAARDVEAIRRTSQPRSCLGSRTKGCP
jgi:hypothetical protein